MDTEEKARRCDGVEWGYREHLGNWQQRCRVYGRWVRSCSDCAFDYDAADLPRQSSLSQHKGRSKKSSF